MKNRNAQGCEVSSEVVSVQIDADALHVLSTAADASFEVATALISVSDDTEL